MNWIHWIGLKYYTIYSLIEEAKKLGVSRRISPQVLKGMGWKDKIFLLGEIPQLPKKGILFGYFTLDRVKYAGKLNKELLDYLADKSKLVECSSPSAEERGCGTEQSGGFYLQTEASIQEMAHLDTNKKAKSISGKLVVFKPMRLTKVKPFRGYMPLSEKDLVKFMKSPILKVKKLEASSLIKTYKHLLKKKDKKSLRRFRKALKSQGLWEAMKSQVAKSV